jgi:putative NIF3 family GTP cyclohydrolase 1 type 2
MKVCEFEDYLRGLEGFLNGEEGILFGDPTADIRGVQVSWMGDVAAAKNAIRTGANLLLVHEAPFYPYPGIRSGIPPVDCLSWPPNRVRTRLYNEGDLSVIRFHSTLDKICVLDDFARALGLGEPTVKEEGLVQIYTVDAIPVADLIKDVKDRLGLDAVRVSGADDLNKPVRRIGLAVGGCALFVNVGFQARLLRHQPDVIIAGESDAYGMLFATESGVPMIETSHAVSENFGMRHFTDTLRQNLPDIRIEFFENPRSWAIR